MRSSTTKLANGAFLDGLRGLASTYRHNQLAPERVAVISSFPPRECGIATFTRDLVDAIRPSPYLGPISPLCPPAPWVIAMEEAGQHYAYTASPALVRATIVRENRSAYRDAAEAINASTHTRIVLIQHEYGLYGGEWGEYLLDFLRTVERPVVTTMHTVLAKPDPVLRRVTEQLINASSAVVVLAQAAREILAQYYPHADMNKVQFIPHGTPSGRREPVTRHQRALGLEGHTILSTFGLLGPDKGIEFAIRALADVVADHPDVLYLVLGQTHPGQIKRGGESYRQMLESLVAELGLQRHVRFYNRYLSLKELLGFLRATDVYVMPYLNPQQIVSGTLAYAVACGKAVVATPFTYAREILADGRGMLAAFRDSQALGGAINRLLDDPMLKERIESSAYTYGRRMHWPGVGVTYLRLLRRVMDDYEAQHRARQAAFRYQTKLRARRKLAPAIGRGASGRGASGGGMRIASPQMGVPFPAVTASALGGEIDTTLAPLSRPT